MDSGDPGYDSCHSLLLSRMGDFTLKLLNKDRRLRIKASSSEVSALASSLIFSHITCLFLCAGFEAVSRPPPGLGIALASVFFGSFGSCSVGLCLLRVVGLLNCWLAQLDPCSAAGPGRSPHCFRHEGHQAPKFLSRMLASLMPICPATVHIGFDLCLGILKLDCMLSPRRCTCTSPEEDTFCEK